MSDSPTRILELAIEKVWDLDDSMGAEHVEASTLGRFAKAFRDAARSEKSVPLLALFAARRALGCWQLYCDGREPIEGVLAAQRFLVDGEEGIDFRAFSTPAVPSFRGVRIVDCRECDTSCASHAVAHLARLLDKGDLAELAFCISHADMAFDQSPLGSRDPFRRWLIEVAIPAALEGRELTEEEKYRFQEYTILEVEAGREGESGSWK